MAKLIFCSRLKNLHRHQLDEETTELLEQTLARIGPSAETLARIDSALEITKPKGIIFPFYIRIGATGIIPMKVASNEGKKMDWLLSDIERIRPIVEKISGNASKRRLEAGLELHPLVRNMNMPALVFRDSKGPVFWTVLGPSGNSRVVDRIQGIRCRRDDNSEDPEKLERLKNALGKMGYSRLRDGLFAEIGNACSGRFDVVHYSSHGGTKQNEFRAFARRMKLEVNDGHAVMPLGKARPGALRREARPV